jgi:hypothetical protein
MSILAELRADQLLVQPALSFELPLLKLQDTYHPDIALH